MKRMTFVLLLLAITGQAQAALVISNAGSGSLDLPAGITNATFNVYYVNDTGMPVTLHGALVLDFSLAALFSDGSGLTPPTLNNPIPDVSTTPFIDLAVSSIVTPLGTLGANNFTGFDLGIGSGITLGTLSVNIPLDFRGSFRFESNTGELQVSLSQFVDLVAEGTRLDGTVTVGRVPGRPGRVPEAPTWALVGFAMALLVARRRRLGARC